MINSIQGTLPTRVTLINFKSPEDMRGCKVMDDAGIYGASTGTIQFNPDNQTCRFKGYTVIDCSIEQHFHRIMRTGYVGMMKQMKPPVSFQNCAYDCFEIRVKGDGRTYIFNIAPHDQFAYLDAATFQCIFDTKKDEWELIRLPFREFLFVLRGQLSDKVPSVQDTEIGSIGFVQSQRYQGPFELEIDFVDAIVENAIMKKEKTKRFNLLPD